MELSFGKAIVIKTKDANVLNTLDTIDANKWRNQENPPLRYEHLSLTGPDKDGFFRGLLCDGQEKDDLHNVERHEHNRLVSEIAGKAQEEEVLNPDNLEKLSMIKDNDVEIDSRLLYY